MFFLGGQQLFLNFFLAQIIGFVVQAIDVWMGACTAFIFAALIEFTIVNYLWRKYKMGFALKYMHERDQARNTNSVFPFILKTRICSHILNLQAKSHSSNGKKSGTGSVMGNDDRVSKVRKRRVLNCSFRAINLHSSFSYVERQAPLRRRREPDRGDYPRWRGGGRGGRLRGAGGPPSPPAGGGAAGDR